MAERLLQKGLVEAQIKDIKVISAGVSAYEGYPASSYGVEVISELGIDMRDHRSQPLTKKMIDEASLILVMTHLHKLVIEEDFGPVKTPIMLWREFRPTQKQVTDPYGADRETYKHSRDLIAEAVPDWVEWVKKNLKET